MPIPAGEALVLPADLASLISTVSEQQQLLTELQIEMVKSLQVLHLDQQRLAAMVAQTGQPMRVAAATPVPAQVPMSAPAPHVTERASVEFVCVGLNEADPYFQALQSATPQGFSLRCAGMHDALSIAKARPAGTQTVIQLFNIAAMVQDMPDHEKAAATSDRIFHCLELAGKLGANVVWTVTDLPRSDRPHAQIAHELYRHMAKPALTVIVPSADMLAQLRLTYPQIAAQAQVASP
jgi:hypothetical protein